MIVKAILITALMISAFSNVYYAGKGEMKKSRNSCIFDSIFATSLSLMVIFWG